MSLARLRLFLLPLAMSATLWAAEEKEEDVYQAPDAFIAESFGGHPPAPTMLWLSKTMRHEIKRILGHDYAGARVRFWTDGSRTAWILDEIGKVKPITTGIVVVDGQIERLKVLIYRESHGWEVKHPFFTDRFRGVGLRDDGRLNRSVDNIAGATLSVNALQRLGALALYLDRSRMAGRAGGRP